MKGKDFYDLNHINNYLKSSLIRYDGEPIIPQDFSHEDDGKFRIYYVNTRDRSRGDARSDDPKLDYNPVPLGYVNWVVFGQRVNVYAAMRIPLRVWKVGLCSKSLSIRPLGYTEDPPTTSKMMTSVQLAMTVKGQYPTFAQACDEMIESEAGEAFTAFSRRFAISKHGALYNLYHQKPVGSWNRGTRELDLRPRFKFLHEVLAEDVNHEAI